MKTVLTRVTERQVVTAIHQFEGLILETDDGTQYSFVPLTYVVAIGKGDKVCTGTVTLIYNGRFTNHESDASLYFRKAGTTEALIELDILVELNPG